MIEQNNLIKKVRRRLVAFFNSPTTTPDIIIRIAKICGIKIPTELEKKYNGSEEP